MNREFLKEQGLTDEQIESVMKEHGKTLNETKAKADKVDGLESQIEGLEEQIEQRDNQLTELKKANPEELQQRIQELEESNETTASEYQERLDQQAFDFSLERSLINANVHNPKAVKALLDVDQIKPDGDKLLGLDTQLEDLKESDPYLFKDENNQSNIFAGGNASGGQGITKNPFSKEHWNLTEQGKLFKENPTLYKNLKSQVGK